MGNRKNSKWNQYNELKCMIIFRKLENAGFPRGKQAEFCRELAKTTNISSGSISAKICNYKSVAGINNESHPSIATLETFRECKNKSINELEKDILNYK